MKRVCLLVGVAALATMDGMAEFRTNDVNGVTMVYDVGSDGVRVESSVEAEPSVASGTVGAIVIPETIDGTRVVAIGDYAFSGCSGITSITLPNTITNIGAYAFSGCAIAEIDLPAGLRSLGGAAFLNCKKLKSIVVPGGVACLSSRAGLVVESSSGSSSCSGIISGGLGPNYSSTSSTSTWSTSTTGSATISEGTFEGCSSLSSVVIQEGVREIGYRTFAKCLRLLALSFPASVMTIGDEAFYGCRSLQKIEFLGDEPSVSGWNVFKGTPASLTVEVKKDAWWYDPITVEHLQTWLGRRVSYEGDCYGASAEVDEEEVNEKMQNLVSYLQASGTSLSSSEIDNYVRWGRQIAENHPNCRTSYQELLQTLGATLTDSESAYLTTLVASEVSKASSGGGLVVTNETSSETSSGTGSSSSGGVAAQTVAANLTVTNVVVHYVQEVENVASVATATSGGLVAVVSEVLGSSTMSIPSSWTNSYPQFVEMFGDDFAFALMKPSGKVGSDGAALQVWQDYVAGTDPTDPTSRFAATIDFVDGTPVVTWSPNVSDGSRVYRIWGKKSLADADWTQIDAAMTAGYNFFKVTVEMK